MAGFDIDKVKAGLDCQSSGNQIVVNELLDFFIAEYDLLIVGSDAEFGIEQRVVVGDPWFEPSGVGAAEAA